MKRLSLILLVDLAITSIVFGAMSSEQSKASILSALDLFMTGNYSCDFLLEHNSNNLPSEKLKMLHVVSEQYGEMIRWEPDGPTGGNVFPVIVRDGKYNKVINGKVYAFSIQDPQYNPLVSLRQAFEEFKLMLEKLPVEFRQKAIQCDGKPGLRITVNFPKNLTPEQLDTLQRNFPQATPEDFKDFGVFVFNVGKQNGFLYGIELYDAKGKRKDDMLSFSNVKLNPEWSLDDFTPPADLETVKISTKKQFEKAFPSAQNQPVSKRSRKSQSFGDFLSRHRGQIWTALIVVLRYAGILLLLAGIGIYFWRKRH